MTSDIGWREPVEARDAGSAHDDLEHWLRGIHADLTENPLDWLAVANPRGRTDAPPEGMASPTDTDDDPAPSDQGQPTGRHRRSD